MNNVLVLLADGFEEVEALGVVDVIRRAKVSCDMVSINRLEVVGSHGIRVLADKVISDVSYDDYQVLVLPGGKVGVDNLLKSNVVLEWVKNFFDNGKLIGAICAAPTVVSQAIDLEGCEVTCYPSDEFKNKITESGAKYVDRVVVVSDNLVSASGVSETFPFSYQLLEEMGIDSEELKSVMLYNSLCRSIKDDSTM